jgi:hypothetical protein
LELVLFIFVEFFLGMHAKRTRVNDGVANRGSGREYNNQPLSGIDSGGTAVRGDGGGGARRRQQWQRQWC